MTIPSDDSIINSFIDQYNIISDKTDISPSINKSDSKSGYVFDQVKNIVITSSNNKELESIKTRLEELSPKLNQSNQIQSIIHLADKGLNPNRKDSPTNVWSYHIEAEEVNSIYEEVNTLEKLDTWVNQGEEGENRSSIRDKVVDFLKDPSQTRLYLPNSTSKELPDIFDDPCFVERLEFLDLSESSFSSLPSSIGELKALKYLDLFRSADISLPKELGDLESLETLDLCESSITSLPNSIGNLKSLRSLDLFKAPHLTALPSGILNLPKSCSVNVKECNFPESITERLREISSTSDYKGPLFSLSTVTQTPQIQNSLPIDESGGIFKNETLIANLYSLAKREHPPLENMPMDNKILNTWLSRLSWTSDYNVKGELQQNLINRILNCIEQANSDPKFLNTFLSSIAVEGSTCGDGIVLSVVKLDIVYQLENANLSDMKSLAHLLSRGVWSMNMLEEIAENKVHDSPLADDVEVYLGYPLMLKEDLELPIYIEKMAHFGDSSITSQDLKLAKEFVNERLNNPDSLNAFLISQDKWITSLEINYPEKMEELLTTRDNASLEAETNEDYVAIEANYKQGLISLTKQALS
jgi:hypothetical protein